MSFRSKFVLLLLFTSANLALYGCSAPQSDTAQAEIPAANEIIEKPLAYDFAPSHVWESLAQIDSKIASAKRTLSVENDGEKCETTNAFDGEIWVCSFQEQTTEIHYSYFGSDNKASDKIAKALVLAFAREDMPYTETDKGRIIREFREYSTEKPPLQFPTRWVAINTRFINVERVFGPSKSGFKITANPSKVPF